MSWTLSTGQLQITAYLDKFFAAVDHFLLLPVK